MRINLAAMFSITFLLAFLSYPVNITFTGVDSSGDISSIQCRTNMTSTCPNYKITNWNTRHVGRHLKRWIRSVSIEWKADEPSLGGNHCKAFIIKQNAFFYNYAPDAISPDLIILGKINQQNDDEKMQSKFQEDKSNKSRKPKLHGPIWADFSNRHEWSIERHPNKVLARLSHDAVMGSGLYYGVLSNDEMKLGK
jgi:hypothetical protein